MLHGEPEPQRRRLVLTLVLLVAAPLTRDAAAAASPVASRRGQLNTGVERLSVASGILIRRETIGQPLGAISGKPTDKVQCVCPAEGYTQMVDPRSYKNPGMCHLARRRWECAQYSSDQARCEEVEGCIHNAVTGCDLRPEDSLGALFRYGIRGGLMDGCGPFGIDLALATEQLFDCQARNPGEGAAMDCSGTCELQTRWETRGNKCVNTTECVPINGSFQRTLGRLFARPCKEGDDLIKCFLKVTPESCLPQLRQCTSMVNATACGKASACDWSEAAGRDNGVGPALAPAAATPEHCDDKGSLVPGKKPTIQKMLKEMSRAEDMSFSCMPSFRNLEDIGRTQCSQICQKTDQFTIGISCSAATQGSCSNVHQMAHESCDPPTKWMQTKGCKNYPSWAENKYCRKTCWKIGQGYEGDDCATNVCGALGKDSNAQCAFNVQWAFTTARHLDPNHYDTLLRRVSNVTIGNATIEDYQRLYFCGLFLDHMKCSLSPCNCSSPPCAECPISRATVYDVSNQKEQKEEVHLSELSGKFMRGESLSNKCPMGGVRITTPAECREAALVGGYEFKGAHRLANEEPNGCFLYLDPSARASQGLYLNINPGGHADGKANHYLICAKEECNICGQGTVNRDLEYLDPASQLMRGCGVAADSCANGSSCGRGLCDEAQHFYATRSQCCTSSGLDKCEDLSYGRTNARKLSQPKWCSELSTQEYTCEMYFTRAPSSNAMQICHTPSVGVSCASHGIIPCRAHCIEVTAASMVKKPGNFTSIDGLQVDMIMEQGASALTAGILCSEHSTGILDVGEKGESKAWKWNSFKKDWNCDIAPNASSNATTLAACQTRCEGFNYIAFWSKGAHPGLCRCYPSCIGGIPSTKGSENVVYEKVLQVNPTTNASAGYLKESHDAIGATARVNGTVSAKATTPAPGQAHIAVEAHAKSQAHTEESGNTHHLVLGLSLFVVIAGCCAVVAYDRKKPAVEAEVEAVEEVTFTDEQMADWLEKEATPEERDWWDNASPEERAAWMGKSGDGVGEEGEEGEEEVREEGVEEGKEASAGQPPAPLTTGQVKAEEALKGQPQAPKRQPPAA